MALITCPECKKEISDQAKMCPHCGYELPKKKSGVSPRKKTKSALIIGGVFLAFLIVGGGYFFFSPVTLQWCCYHHISDATCVEPETCSRCGKTWGDPLGHAWQEATCVEAKRCTVCGATERDPLGHRWSEATCTTPKTCTVCKVTEGSEKGHNWSPATCTTPKTCKNCGKREGMSAGHVVQDYICTKCKETIVSKYDVPNILDITTMEYEINYVGGIDVYITFVNKSSVRTINYITVEMEFYNAVGDVLTDDISRDTTASLLFTGPLNAGKKSSKTYWRACFYNATFSGTVEMKKIEIEYSDGSTLTLDEDVAMYAVKAWR